MSLGAGRDAGTSSSSGDAGRVHSVLTMVEAAARRAPVPALHVGCWRRHSSLLAPLDADLSLLPPVLQAAAVGPGSDVVQPAAATRRRRTAGDEPTGAGLQGHAVLLSRLDTDRLRARAFYRGVDGSRTTLVVHQRTGWRRGPLLVGAAVQRAMSTATAMQVPAVLGAGRSWTTEWLAEEHVTGRHLRPDEHPDSAVEVMEELVGAWTRLGTRHVRGGASAPDVASVVQLLRSEHAHDVRAEEMASSLAGLMARTTTLTVGPRHGDPVMGNVLRADDGRLVLLDWEFARVGPVARDMVKLALAVPDLAVGRDLLAAQASVLGGGSTGTPWQGEVAAALVAWLAGWRAQQVVHERSGRAAPFQRRLRRRLELLRGVVEG